MTEKPRLLQRRLKNFKLPPDIFGDERAEAGSAVANEAETPLSESSARSTGDSAETVAVFDPDCVLRQIEQLLRRPYYGDQDELMGSEVRHLSEWDQLRFGRLVDLYNDMFGGRRRVLVGDDDRVTAIERTKRLCPAFHDVIDLIGRATVLSQRTGTPIVVPPILLLGPPGVGKTHASKQIASALRTDINEMSCATNSDAQALFVGHPTTWRGARMGILTEAIATGKDAQPVVLLDEIDKFVTYASERPYNTLLTVLERENSRALVDEFVRVPFDVSGAIFVATANDAEALPSFIKDRMTVFNITPPTGKALLAVTALIAEGLVAELRGGVDMPNDEVLRRAARHNPRRIGKLLRLAFGFAARDGRDALTIQDVEAAELVVTGGERPRQFGFMTAASDGQA